MDYDSYGYYENPDLKMRAKIEIMRAYELPKFIDGV
jgi:hypothetical protein